MKSCENHIASCSEYYNYTPSMDAKRAFFYPICTGYFIYEVGYHKHRNSFDSFLLMYIKNGELELKIEDHVETVKANHFVLLDCYRSHGYQTAHGWECIWIHFDGPVARSYYDMIISHLGNIFSINDSHIIVNKMMKIYNTFSNSETIHEAMLSKLICDILTSLLLYIPKRNQKDNLSKDNLSKDNLSLDIDEIVSYITEHFTENLTVEMLAKKIMLSSYHFIRIFKKETGFTPHEYLINTRISNAKYLLKHSHMSIKDICFHTGFSCESVFCTCFRNNVKMTPTSYRNNIS